jgi:hypothetical protein
MTQSILSSFILLGTLPALCAAGDLSKYRDFQLGTGLAEIAKQIGGDPSLARTIHRRPALMQELEWRPRSLGPSSGAEAVEGVVFGFYDGSLFRITVRYGRYETEGMIADDLVEAISATYGPAVRPTTAAVTAEQGPYGDQEHVLARWEDTSCRFELVSTSYGPSFKLTGVLKTVEAKATAANLEARRMDDLEAPQRDSARIANEEQLARAKLEKARLVNKPKFRP